MQRRLASMMAFVLELEQAIAARVPHGASLGLVVVEGVVGWGLLIGKARRDGGAGRSLLQPGQELPWCQDLNPKGLSQCQ